MPLPDPGKSSGSGLTDWGALFGATSSSGSTTPTPARKETPAKEGPASRPSATPGATDSISDASIGARGEGSSAATTGPADQPKQDDPNKPKQEGQGSDLDMDGLRAKIVVTDLEDITFDDIKGQDKAVDEIKEVGDMLRFEAFYQIFGAQMPRGILLAGPPGTGKTMMATALANSAQAAFLSVDCSHVMSKWLGEPEKTVNAIFDIAEQEADNHPNGHSILFLDEIEALLRSRDSDSHEASEKVLSIFLQRLNGLKKSGKVTIIGCTNRPDKLDAAFISRMSAVIEVPFPDEAGRAAIFESRLDKCQDRVKENLPDIEHDFIGEIDYAGIAKVMVGRSGQDVISGRELDNLANEIVKRRGAAALKAFIKDPANEEIIRKANDDKVGKVDINAEILLKYAGDLESIDTEEVLRVAMDYEKTGFMFDKRLGTDDYLRHIDELHKQDREAAAAKEAASEQVEGEAAPEEEAPRYSLTDQTREEARAELIDAVKGRIEEGEVVVLNDLYATNASMPEQIRGVVSSFISGEIKQQEAFEMLEAMRDDDSIEPPHMPMFKAPEELAEVRKRAETAQSEESGGES